ncbi:MAG: CHRD domain-containing protein [Gammaproteobacteria bacterium]|nr:CHRD domain-containing protein [Gammaproteobacteria bacterium]MCY4357926.1 CHRD domain-containing protein [Gammaproteobacteria bacterium]
MKTGRQLSGVLLLGTILFTLTGTAQEQFRARLSPMPTTPQTVTEITGEGEALLYLSGNTLSVEGHFSGMSSPATAAHLHHGAPAQPGPVVHNLAFDASLVGTLRATLELSDEQVAALHNNELYLQVHSNNNPTGELRGWIFLRSHFDRP